jgi:3-oxoacyl-[acyl-carrier-protein] synthase II
MIKLYIRGAASISPQETYGPVTFLKHGVAYRGNILKAIEPDYSKIIDSKLIRRMSRIIRMGVTTAMECLKEAGIQNPGAIVTATGYGCLEDTEIFLKGIIEKGEDMLLPKAFIQSTHNAIGAQIALILQCNQYNNTFVHGGLSFESALQDAMLLLQENEAINVLVGSVDEVTDLSHTLLSRFGLYKRDLASNLKLFESDSKGTIAGEGSAFFLLTNQPSSNDYAQLEAIATFYKPFNSEEMSHNIISFLSSNSIKINDIDLIISGKNGDNRNDHTYDLAALIPMAHRVVHYKHLCGEYPTSTSFALWLASNIIRTGLVPEAVSRNKYIEAGMPKRVLIYNNYLNKHHSLLMLVAC